MKKPRRNATVQLLSLLKRVKKTKPQESERRHVVNSIGLVDLIAAGLIELPARLFRNYKGMAVEAILLADGKVQFQDTVYDSCSTAAEMARSKVTGRRMNTNGWSFWQCVDSQNKTTTLFEIRQRFESMKQPPV
ncbi:MAG: hypothetical protein ACJ8FY_15865 [Gemmataceae bacterium]